MSNGKPPVPAPDSSSAIVPSQSGGAVTGGGAASPPPWAGTDEPGIPWARYIDALRRQLWLVILLSGLGWAAGVYLSRRVPLVYEADARLLVTSGPGAASNAAVGGDAAFRSMSSWDGLTKSYAVVEPVVRSLNLYVSRAPKDSALFRSFSPPDSATFRPGRYRLTVDSLGRTYTLANPDRPEVVEHGAVGDSLGRSLGFSWAPPAGLLPAKLDVTFSATTVHSAASGLIGAASTSLPEQGQFLTIRLSGRDPRRTAMTLNGWALQLQSTALEIKKSAVSDARNRVSAQVATVQKQLQADEARLEAFRDSTIMMTPDAGFAAAAGAGLGGVLQLETQLDATQRMRAGLEGILAAADSNGGVVKADGFYMVPQLLSNWPQLKQAVDDLVGFGSQIRTKLVYMTKDNPELGVLLSQDSVLSHQTIPRISRDIIANLRITERDLAARLDAQKKDVQGIPARTILAQQLGNRVANSQTLFNTLQARLDALKLIDAETAPDITFFQAATVPTVPSSNQGPRLFMMAVVAGIGAGLALALLRDRMDRRFRYPEQATYELGLAIIGTVPSLSFKRKGGLSVSAMSQVVESFRTLRLAVRYHFTPGQSIVLCVSSAGPGEGKSLVSSNLAIAFANAGQKTLLIDGDVRRGGVHTAFGIERRPGLVDYLGGNTITARDIIQATTTDHLFVVPSGSRSRRAPEFLVSDRMAGLVAQMRDEFEVVVIDSPPFAAGMDAYALAAAAGAMVVVLRRGLTDRKLAAAKLEILDRLPVSVLGAVVNGIASDASYRYYGYDGKYAMDEDMKDETDFSGAIAAPGVPQLTRPK